MKWSLTRAIAIFWTWRSHRTPKAIDTRCCIRKACVYSTRPDSHSTWGIRPLGKWFPLYLWCVLSEAKPPIRMTLIFLKQNKRWFHPPTNLLWTFCLSKAPPHSNGRIFYHSQPSSYKVFSNYKYILPFHNRVPRLQKWRMDIWISY